MSNSLSRIANQLKEEKLSTIQGDEARTPFKDKAVTKLKPSIEGNKLVSPDLDNFLYDSNIPDFDKRSVIYIDNDVHEVFSLLKKTKKRKLNFGNIFSYLGKLLIEAHDEEIKEAINGNHNQYL